MTSTTDTARPRTARHFEEGTAVMHREFGLGVICIDGCGQKYPQFENATGTAMTRVIPAEAQA